MSNIKLIFMAIQEGISHTEKKMLKIDDFSIRDKTIAQFAASKAIRFYIENVANQPLDADTEYSGNPDNNPRKDVDIFHAPML